MRPFFLRTTVLAAVVALFQAEPTRADAPTLSLQDAVEIALKNHPLLRAAGAQASLAQEEVTEAHAAYLPQVSVVATGSVANQPSRLGAGFLPASQLFNRFGQGVALSQLITDSGRTQNLVQASRLRAQASQKDYAATRAEVLLEVNRAYFGVLRAQSLVKVARETVDARRVLADQVTALANNKLRSGLDVSFADVNLSEGRLMKIRADEQLEAAYAELARSLGLDGAMHYALVEEPLPPSPPADATGLPEKAIENRPDLSSLKLARDAAHSFEKAERDLARPTVSFVGVAGFIPLIQQNPGTRIPNEYEAAAVNVAIPVFTGHLFAARRNAAHYEAVTYDEHTRELAQSVARDVRVAWGGAYTAFQRLDVTAQLLSEASSGLDLARGRYELGLSSIVELTQAELNLTQAEVENLSAKYDYEIQYAFLQYTLGLLR